MKSWIPIPGSVTGRLVESGQKLFEIHGFDAVNVQQIAEDAGVTTGALYHHFGSKKGLYHLIREDLEKRVVDRMDAAVQVIEQKQRDAIRTAVLVGFDSATKLQMSRILSEQGPGDRVCLIQAYLEQLIAREAIDVPGSAQLLVASLRTALLLCVSSQLSTDAARCALQWMLQ